MRRRFGNDVQRALPDYVELEGVVTALGNPKDMTPHQDTAEEGVKPMIRKINDWLIRRKDEKADDWFQISAQRRDQDDDEPTTR